MRGSEDSLGHVIRLGKLSMGVKTYDAVQHMWPSHNQTDMKILLGLCNVFRCFVPNFSRIVVPLTAVICK